VAVVTGASKGIGAGIAKRLGELGASVVVNYASSKEVADRVVAEFVKKVCAILPAKGHWHPFATPSLLNKSFI
jgi:3-oxoacyl-[acyl-carrier protein] reductase